MKVEEKSKQLINKFREHVDCFNIFESFDCDIQEKNAIQCALICVDEIKEALENYEKSSDVNDMDGDFIYWNEVKQLLLKL